MKKNEREWEKTISLACICWTWSAIKSQIGTKKSAIQVVFMFDYVILIDDDDVGVELKFGNFDR